MRKTVVHRFLILFLLGFLASSQVSAQYMPVVFDKTYGERNKTHQLVSMDGDEVALIGKEGQAYNVTWIDRNGEVVFSMPLHGFMTVNELKALDDNRIMVVGQSQVLNLKKNKKDTKEITICGRVTIFNRDGRIVTDFYAGSQSCELLKCVMLKSGAFIVSGTEPRGANGRQGIIMKVNKSGDPVYVYRNAESGYCAHFEVLGNTVEYVCAAFSAEKDTERAAIVRLDEKGKPYYITAIPARRFMATGICGNINDGSVILSGNSNVDGGVIYKIRPEGDIVFEKVMIPASVGTDLQHLWVARNGNIFVGGNGIKGHYALLRSDGTSLYTSTSTGAVTGMGMNTNTGESVVATYDASTRRGTFVRISSTGKAEFERPVDGKYTSVNVLNNSDVLLLSPEEGRISMLSAKGEKIFDRYISDNKPTRYTQAIAATSGEVLFVDDNSRVVKLGHGLYVSDVKISKPVNGVATAVFTVTLTGYATTKEGAPIPVSVGYGTVEGTATVANNYVPVQGKLAFTPSRGAADRYLVTQDIEVQIKANNLIEGVKDFEMRLSEVQNSYIVKNAGKGVIEDQMALVRLVRTEDGVEGSKDILYELGLFKSDGTALTNATGANIIVDGNYGEGTADALDFEMGLTPRVIFTNGEHKAQFLAKTIEDTRYEMPKSVVINFNKIYSISSSNVVFNGDLLSCSGTVIDQPAQIMITSLGDHRLNSNVISGFFSVSLVRASDGALLTNNTGSDIVINCANVADASAKEGKDFVYTNLYDVRIGGDGNHASANVNGVVLYSTDTAEKTVKLQIKSVNQPKGAQAITIVADGGQAEFKILK